MNFLSDGLMTEDEIDVNSNINFYEEFSLDATAASPKGDTAKKLAMTALSLGPALASAAPCSAALATL